jgi:uncharacterized phage protein (TIGR01671 family)
MNDRYLFKAKQLDNQEWLEGSLIVRESTMLIGYYIFTPPTMQDPCGSTEWVEDQVDPATVCQYTTLTDKNGGRIWESDFVKTPTGATFVIKWVKKHGDEGVIAPGWLTYGWEPESLEVLRSIHDSPTTQQ